MDFRNLNQVTELNKGQLTVEQRSNVAAVVHRYSRSRDEEIRFLAQLGLIDRSYLSGKRQS